LSSSKAIKRRNNSIANALNARFYHENALAYAKGGYRVTERDSFRKTMDAEMKALDAEMKALVEDG